MKTVIPLVLAVVVFSPLPEYLSGFYLLQRNNLREHAGRLYTTQEYLQRAEEMRSRALASRHDLRLAERGIHSLDELYTFLQSNNSVLLSLEQFISIYRWLPRTHAEQLIAREELTRLLYAEDLTSIACDNRAGFVAFDFLDASNRSLLYIEVAQSWFQPNRSGLVLLSRQRDLESIEIYPGFSPTEFYHALDSLSHHYGWLPDRSFLTDLADRLYHIAVPSPEEILVVTREDSLFNIWRYTPPLEGLAPLIPWWLR